MTHAQSILFVQKPQWRKPLGEANI